MCAQHFFTCTMPMQYLISFKFIRVCSDKGRTDDGIDQWSVFILPITFFTLSPQLTACFWNLFVCITDTNFKTRKTHDHRSEAPFAVYSQATITLHKLYVTCQALDTTWKQHAIHRQPQFCNLELLTREQQLECCKTTESLSGKRRIKRQVLPSN